MPHEGEKEAKPMKLAGLRGFRYCAWCGEFLDGELIGHAPGCFIVGLIREYDPDAPGLPENRGIRWKGKRP